MLLSKVAFEGILSAKQQTLRKTKLFLSAIVWANREMTVNWKPHLLRVLSELGVKRGLAKSDTQTTNPLRTGTSVVLTDDFHRLAVFKGICRIHDNLVIDIDTADNFDRATVIAANLNWT